jgi:PAS domain S-box-containing protein
MKTFSRMRVRTKVNFGIALIVLFSSLVVTFSVTPITSRALIDEFLKQGRVMAGNLALRSTDPLLATDMLALKGMIDELMTVDVDVAYAFIQDEHDRILVHTFNQGFPPDLKTANRVDTTGTTEIVTVDTGTERIYDFATAVTIDNKRLGTVRIGLSQNKIQQVIRGLILTIVLIAGLTLFAAFILAALFSRRITSRIGLLQQHAETIVKGNLDQQPNYPGPVTKCWEIRHCHRTSCVAWGNERYRCWCLSNTQCPECKGMPFPDKLAVCRKCPVFKNRSGDEIQELMETFDIMALTMRSHIDDLKQAEQNMARQRKFLRTILDVSPDLIGLTGPHHTYTTANAAFAKFVGRTVDTVVGCTDEDLFPQEIAASRMAQAQDILLTGAVINEEQLLPEHDGESSRWFHVIRVPMRDQNRKITGVLSTARDISMLKSYQDQLIQSQKLQSLGKLAGGMAHEINTPLGIILGYAQLLQEDVEKDGPLYNDLEIIIKQIHFCKKIVADMLGFSRQSQSEKVIMCFNNSIMEVIHLVRHSFQIEHVQIVTELDDRFPIIQGDPEKLKQVWMNLLSNALDALENGGVIKVKTLLDSINMTITLWIADSGCGIPAKKINSIFDPFFSTKPTGKGTGLGLSVSFGIIKDHHGSIEATSPLPAEFSKDMPEDSGPGTVFKVTLPLEPEQESGSVYCVYPPVDEKDKS